MRIFEASVFVLLSAGSVSAQERVAVSPLPEAVWQAMQGRSWRAGLPCAGRDQLALLRVPYRDFAGSLRRGELILATSAAAKVASVFQQIFDDGHFRIAKMVPIDAYGGDDDASMLDDNTSGFNCRLVEGSGGLSRHASGQAVDINPVENPYVDRTGTWPKTGQPYDSDRKRRATVTGMIQPGDVVTRAFARIGWTWGGNFKTSKDYQHFHAPR